MRDVRVLELLAQQRDIVGWWQLEALDWSPRRIDDIARRHRWQVIYRGVYMLRFSPPSRQQRWIAASLTAPATLLGSHSAGACWGFRPWTSSLFETVVRWGSGGPELKDGLRVSRSLCLADDVAWRGPIPLTSPERTLIDLASVPSTFEVDRATREAVRLGLVTPRSLSDALDRHQGRRGTRDLQVWAKKHAKPGTHRSRSERRGRYDLTGRSGRSDLSSRFGGGGDALP